MQSFVYDVNTEKYTWHLQNDIFIKIYFVWILVQEIFNYSEAA
jgi:hypothetical protein